MIYIASEIPQGEGEEEKKKERLLGTERSWELTSSNEESFLPGTQGRLILCSQLLFDHRPFPNKPSPHQSPTFEPTLYKFIITGPLGLDPVRHWAQSENHDSTIGTICGKGCSCDDECNSLLRQDQVPQRRLWWPAYYTTRGELPGGSQLNGPLALCARLSPPPGVKPLRIQWPALLGPD